jgi:hypothetical protein
MHTQGNYDFIRGFLCCANRGGRLARAGFPRFSIAQMESGWFWCTDASWEMRGPDALIGPYESRDEALKYAWEALGIKEGEQ